MGGQGIDIAQGIVPHSGPVPEIECLCPPKFVCKNLMLNVTL